MRLSFILSMPNSGSWNGKWTGQNQLYAIVKNFRSKEMKEQAQVWLEKKNYYYAWSDGWTAQITIEEVTAAEGRKLQRKSRGFCGYNWMVNSIIDFGKIQTKREPQ